MSTVLQKAKTKDSGAAAFDPSGGDALALASAERAAGRPAVIVTLAAIDGRAPRRLGAQMAVAADGRFAGSISSGCLERAIVEEARAAMSRRKGGVVRYGKESKFLDIVLPCGSGIDLLYTVDPSETVLCGALEATSARRLCALDFYADGARPSQGAEPGWRAGTFTRVYHPPLRIVAAGAGAELMLLGAVAKAAGHEFIALSPDAGTLERCAADRKILLQSSSSPPAMALDRWTAFVFLFHDREWELALAEAVLASPAFYVGAVGSRKTSDARVEALRALGVEEAAIARLRAPIGLIPGARDPSALAISALAEIMAAWPH